MSQDNKRECDHCNFLHQKDPLTLKWTKHMMFGRSKISPELECISSPSYFICESCGKTTLLPDPKEHEIFYQSKRKIEDSQKQLKSIATRLDDKNKKEIAHISETWEHESEIQRCCGYYDYACMTEKYGLNLNQYDEEFDKREKLR